MILYKFFLKFKSSKQKEKSLYETNPEEFIIISKNLINTSSTTRQLLRMIMASRIPLSHLKTLNIKTLHNSKPNILSYILDNGLLIQTYSIVCSNKISRCIENLDKKRLLSIGADKINYVAKKYLILELLLNN
ncbi:hypothetical protein [Borreliella lusitaniae]|uniref:hypothetical protein n=1 Tax=Borreliella lusitaniae TaxID=100177 RepID=UPI003AB6CD6D